MPAAADGSFEALGAVGIGGLGGLKPRGLSLHGLGILGFGPFIVFSFGHVGV